MGGSAARSDYRWAPVCRTSVHGAPVRNEEVDYLENEIAQLCTVGGRGGSNRVLVPVIAFTMFEPVTVDRTVCRRCTWIATASSCPGSGKALRCT